MTNTAQSFSYVDLFTHYPHPISLLLLLILAVLRLAPIVVLAPFYGAKTLPVPVKVGFVISIAIIFLPQLLLTTEGVVHFDLAFLSLALKELLIGWILGFLVSIPFNMASSAGTIVDHQRGASSFMQLDPTMMVQSSPVGQLYNGVLIYVFYAIGGNRFFLQSVALSFETIPVDSWMPAAFFKNFQLPFWQGMVVLLNQFMLVAIQLGAPPVVAMFMSDLFMGIANRMAPQVPMSFLLWALKSIVGVGMLWLGWLFIVQQMEQQTVDWLRYINKTISQFALT